MAIAAQDGPWAQLRTGTVVQASGGTAVVVVGATSFEASIIVPFGVSDPGSSVPAEGTLVMVGRQDSSWAVLGRVLGVSGNLVYNGSFELSGPGSDPDGWTLYAILGTADAGVVGGISTVAGTNAVEVSTVSLASESFLYSAPIPVSTGDTFQISGFVGGVYDDTSAPTADAALFALWFANEGDLYPTVSSPNTLVDSDTGIAALPPWTPLSGTVTAPVDGFMRVALNSEIAADQALLWDFIVARKTN